VKRGEGCHLCRSGMTEMKDLFEIPDDMPRSIASRLQVTWRVARDFGPGGTKNLEATRSTSKAAPCRWVAGGRSGCGRMVKRRFLPLIPLRPCLAGIADAYTFWPSMASYPGRRAGRNGKRPLAAPLRRIHRSQKHIVHWCGKLRLTGKKPRRARVSSALALKSKGTPSARGPRCYLQLAQKG